MWEELGINPTDDPKAIRRAYAARLKALDPDRDLQAFTRLRAALEEALAKAGHASSVMTEARRATDDEDDLSEAPERTMEAPTKDLPIDVARPIDNRPAGASDAVPDWIAASAADHALLDELDSAIISCDAPAAVRSYSRAAATGAIPLSGETRLLDRVLSIAVEDKAIDDAAFREFVRAFGSDQSIFDDAQSEIRRRVLARLAAADWYEATLAAADRRKGETRKQARLSRLVLGRIGRYWMPRVDRAVLKSRLDEYRIHQSWLSDRIDPVWVRTLEARLRRREIVGVVFFILLLGGLLLNAVVVFAMEAVAGTSSLAMLPAGLMIVVFLAWILTVLVKTLMGLVMRPPVVSDQAPPDDQEARLRWLEQQAELAYEAMYDATPGSALAARYSDAKEFLYDAIALARRLGKTERAEHLSRRLAEIKTVFRTQFPG